MPYTIKGKCIYKKDTGKKVGCTKGDVRKYMAALQMHAESAMRIFNKISNILRESEMVPGEINTPQPVQNSHPARTPEELEKRKRMIKRMAALGVATGAGISAVELMSNPEARRGILAAANRPGALANLIKTQGEEIAQLSKPRSAGQKVWDVTKRVAGPMAAGAALDLAVEPVNTMIAQRMEDRLQKKKEKNQI